MKGMFPQGPMGMWMAGVQTAQMLAEAQTVIALRVLGMAGVWSVAPTENMLMMTEKPGAFVRSAAAATAAVMAGKRPDQIASAALRPIAVKTRANSRRLSRRGFKSL